MEVPHMRDWSRDECGINFKASAAGWRLPTARPEERGMPPYSKYHIPNSIFQLHSQTINFVAPFGIGNRSQENHLIIKKISGHV